MPPLPINTNRITSLDNPRVKAVVRLGEQRERRSTGLFLAESWRQVSRADASGMKFIELYICPGFLTSLEVPRTEIDLLAKKQNVKLIEVSEAVFRKMAYRENPEGILAVVEQPVRELPQLIDPPAKPGAEGKNPLWLITVGTTKPGNLGAMVRSAEAAGAVGVIVADAVVDAFHPNAIHASTCAVFTLPVYNAPAGIVRDWLLKQKLRLLAATPAGDVDYDRADMTGPTALVIGTEDVGLDGAWLSSAKKTGAQLRIPMLGKTVDSLNASTAAAILLFEAVRQRRSSSPTMPSTKK